METTESNDFYPFIGLSAYSEELVQSFFGRNEEVSHLLKRINQNIATVLYGKSGIGKTSIIKAGLLPALRKEYMLPIYIKVNYKNKRSTPIEQIKQKILTRLRKVDDNIPEFNDRTLWEYFHEVKLMDGLLKPVLIIDQFEDIFTLGKKNQKEANEVILEVSNLIENQIPVKVSARYEEGKIPYDVKKQNYRIVISLRESFLSYLEDLSSFSPSIIKNKYKLLELNRQSAINIVYNSAKKIITLENAERIVDLILTDSIPDFSKHYEDKELIESFLLEPFVLSLVCYEINEVRLNEKKETISSEIIDKIKINEIIKDFYESSTSDLPKTSRQIIENVLLTFDGYRKLERKSELMLKEDILEEDIKSLINRRIIRTEIWNGNEHIEIIHDILVPIIKKIRDKRIEEERKTKREEELRDIRRHEEKKRLAQKRKMQNEARQEQVRHKQHFKFVLTVSIVLVISSITLFLFWRYADKQSIIAVQKAKEASSNYTAADGLLVADKNPTLGYLLGKRAYVQSATKMSKRAIIKTFYEGNFFSNFIETKTTSLISHCSPKKNNILIAKNNTLFIYSQSGKIIRKFGGYGKITQFEISNNGEFIIISSKKSARLYSYTGEELQVFAGHKRGIRFVTFSPNSQLIATAGKVGKKNSVIIWDLKGNKQFVLNSERGGINTVDFSSDGKHIVTASKNRLLTIWNMKGKAIKKIDFQESVEMAKYSPDGKHIVVSTKGPALYLYSDLGEKIINKNLLSKVNYIDFSADGKYFIASGNDGIITLWGLYLQKQSDFKGHGAPILTCDYTSDMQYLISSSFDNTVKKWKLQKKKPYTLIKTKRPVFYVEISSKKELILSAIKDSVFIWDKKGQLLKSFDNKSRVYSAKFSNSEKYIVTSGKDSLAKIWNLKGELITKLKGHKNIVYTAKFTKDDKNILTASRDGQTILWSLEGKMIETYKNETEEGILDASISNDKKHIAFSTEDELVEIWDRKSKKSIQIKGHNASIYSIVFSPQGDKILTCAVDKTLQTWDLEGNLLKIFKGHRERVNSAEFSPDGKNIISSSHDGTVRYWSINGDELFKFSFHSDVVNSAVFSHDGRYIISASDDKTIKKWPISIDKIFNYIDNEKIYGEIWRLDKEMREKYK